MRVRGGVVAAVAVGGAAGGLARYAVSRAWPVAEHGFPWPTLATNVAGSLLLGVLVALVLEVRPPRPYVRPLLATGVLGAFTTFSTFVVEIGELARHGRAGTAAAYLVVSVVAGLTAAWAGVVLARALPRAQGEVA